ncbi:MAG TPA: hypothetical protein VIS73_05685 [Rhodocyclaceae bacterium]
MVMMKPSASRPFTISARVRCGGGPRANQKATGPAGSVTVTGCGAIWMCAMNRLRMPATLTRKLSALPLSMTSPRALPVALVATGTPASVKPSRRVS